MAIHLCFSTLICPAWTLDQIIRAAQSSGVRGVDFRGIGKELDITLLPEFQPAGLAATSRRLRQAGIECPCLNTSIHLVSTEPQRWSAMLDECSRYSDVGAALGSRYLRVFGGSVRAPLDRAEALLLARRHLEQLSHIAAGQGLTILLETHDDWSTAGAVLEVLGDKAGGRAGALWDIEHPFKRGEPIEETVRQLGAHLRHVHVKDITGERPTLLGEGSLPVADAVQTLERSGYDGWVCLETEKRWRPSGPEPEASLPQFVRFMRETLAGEAQD
jgi:sugar phosphate isomerase/epimerase